MIDEERKRPPPRRSGLVWAREFAEAFAAETGLLIDTDAIARVDFRSPRLRERVPKSVVSLIRASSAAAGFTPSEWVRMGLRNCRCS